jgi:hypothetical protein
MMQRQNAAIRARAQVSAFALRASARQAGVPGHTSAEPTQSGFLTSSFETPRKRAAPQDEVRDSEEIRMKRRLGPEKLNASPSN